jgi:hypothetical protein
MLDDDGNEAGNEPGTTPDGPGRDAKGRWVAGHCPNPKGRPKKRRCKNYNPSDIRHFMSTQIEVNTADGPQAMDRRTALLIKLYENAMKGKPSAQRLILSMTEKSDKELVELRYRYEIMVGALVLDNPDFRGLDELSARDRHDLLAAARVLDHYYPGQYAGFLEPREPDPKWQKSSVVQILKSVPQVLTSDTTSD